MKHDLSTYKQREIALKESYLKISYLLISVYLLVFLGSSLSACDTAGDKQGDMVKPAGAPAEEYAGEQAGEAAGASAGAPAEEDAGALAGASAGALAGASAGALAGASAGALAGAPNVSCVYPDATGDSYDNNIDIETVFPPIRWERSYSLNGEAGDDQLFSLRDVHCEPTYDWVKTINIVTSAGWCVACPTYLRELTTLSAELRDAGGLLIYVEVEDADYLPADLEYARSHLVELLTPETGEGIGIIVGDLDSAPLERFFGQSPASENFPGAFVIRRRDMTVISRLEDNRTSGLPLIEIAFDPERDWSIITPTEE